MSTKNKPWGLLLCVDLKNCHPGFIRDAQKIQDFVDQLCQLLKLKKFGQTQIVHFGKDPKVNGFSMTQLIETSLISGHFANHTNCAYLDIFSCQLFDPKKAGKFCQDFFEAKSMRIKITFRY